MVDSPSYHVPPQLISDEFHRAPGTADRRGWKFDDGLALLATRGNWSTKNSDEIKVAGDR